jgi:hypothetical protein
MFSPTTKKIAIFYSQRAKHGSPHLPTVPLRKPAKDEQSTPMNDDLLLRLPTGFSAVSMFF